MVIKKPAISKIADNATSHNGTPKGIRIIITTGEVSGMIENQNAIGPEGGLFTIIPNITIERIRGKVTGSINC